ncbi:prepilin-type N-terminal cleavage/methylation domain-containing protein [bacterium]|nr:prepilin-type N-terminal cleavage/methylation domain-containing protein [bacterium]
MIKKIQTKKGFTLIEVLVAITIFMIFMTSISSAYLNIARGQREANAVRVIYSEMRYVFNLIGEEAREKTIDYGCPGEYGSCAKLNNIPKSNYLALISDDGTKRTVFLVEDDIKDGIKKLYYYKEVKQVGTNVWNVADGFKNGYEEIELKNIVLDNFAFEISPLVDPFNPDNIGCGAIQFQPMVSVYTTIRGVNSDVSNFKLDLQTTISSRVYNHQTNF